MVGPPRPSLEGTKFTQRRVSRSMRKSAGSRDHGSPSGEQTSMFGRLGDGGGAEMDDVGLEMGACGRIEASRACDLTDIRYE